MSYYLYAFGLAFSSLTLVIFSADVCLLLSGPLLCQGDGQAAPRGNGCVRSDGHPAFYPTGILMTKAEVTDRLLEPSEAVAGWLLKRQRVPKEFPLAGSIQVNEGPRSQKETALRNCI